MLHSKTLLLAAALAAAPAAWAQSGPSCPSNGQPPNGWTLCNNGPIDPDTWVYGPTTNLTPKQQAAEYWNPVKARVVAGLPFSGRRVSAAGPQTPGGYCSVAPYDQAGNHFTWVDMVHSGLTYSQAWPMWPNAACPALNFTTTAARGVQTLLDEREGQHSADGGAALYIIPVRSADEAREAVFWTYYPPVGHHSAGSNQIGSVYTGNTPSPDGPGQIGVVDAGGYRNSFNRNVVMIAQIRSVQGAEQAAAIAAVEGIHAVHLDEADLASQAGAGYEALAQSVRAAVQASGKHFCTTDLTTTPHTMNCARL